MTARHRARLLVFTAAAARMNVLAVNNALGAVAYPGTRGARSLKLRDFERRVRLVSHHPLAPGTHWPATTPPGTYWLATGSVQRGLEQPKLNFYTKIL